MPPPELIDRPAPASVGTLVLENLRAEAPMSRHRGDIAEEANLRARLAESRARNDTAEERALSTSLARLLAARGRDLGVATKLARRALMIGDDPALRIELSGWLAGLGEHVLAAATLRGAIKGADPQADARLLVKIAVLLARSGDAAGAAETLDEATSLDPSDAMPVELFGTLAAWAPEIVPPEGAAAAYLTAAERRDAAGDAEAAFEDRLRAFEVAPFDEAAAEAVSAALAARAQTSAADEVLRLHAAAIERAAPADPEGSARARAVHRRRMLAALKDGDAARAAGAMIDAGLEAEVEGSDAAKIDEVLTHAGLFELTALRLELRADQRAGPARAAVLEALAKLHSGPLASPDRAIEAWIEALAADPSNAAARAALRDHAAALYDPAPLAEALVRVGLRSSGDVPSRIAAMRELVALAADKIDDPALAVWALDRIAEAGGADLVNAEKSKFSAALAQREDEIAAAKRALFGGERRAALTRLASLLAFRVGDHETLTEVLGELVRVEPSDRAHAVALARIASRTGDDAPLASAFEALVAVRSKDPADAGRSIAVRARLGLAAIERRRGDDKKALAHALAALADSPGHRPAACAALFSATRIGDVGARAVALRELAGPAWPALRSTLLAASAELSASSGSRESARLAAAQACETDPASARAVMTLAKIAGFTKAAADGAVQVDRATRGSGVATHVDRMAAAALERAMAVVLPLGDFCEELASAFDALSEAELALAWTQRRLALRPGSPDAMADLLRRASATGDASKIAEALAWVLAQPKPLADLTDTIVAAIDAVLARDRTKARSIARRALDVLGPRVAVLRARLLDMSARIGDPGLAISVLERYLAVESLGPHAGDLLLELSRRRANAGDYDGAARELSRASEGETHPDMILERIAEIEAEVRDIGATLGSEGLIALAEARSRALLALGPERASAAASALRELGSLRWDLADDKKGAEESFFLASEVAPRGGVERYARDMVEFAGINAAIESLVGRAGRVHGENAKRERATLLIEAANVANDGGMPEHALLAAASAIESDPSRADAVALVEKNAGVEGGLEILDQTYDRLAAAALGCYGRRAAHYRAARQLERRGALDLALKHAVASFEAVPSEGTSYVLLSRLADRSGDATEAVRALERVAETGDVSARVAWLKRAGSLAGKSDEGARTRFELLLRALLVSPDYATVVEVSRAANDLSNGAGEADFLAMRVERAVRASLPKLDGPDGARTGVEMAKLAGKLGIASLFFAALTRAMSADGDIDEFASVDPDHGRSEPEAREWLERLKTTAKKPYSSVGAPLLRLGASIARVIGDAEIARDLAQEAARRAGDDDAGDMGHDPASSLGAMTEGVEDDSDVDEADALRAELDAAPSEDKPRVASALAELLVSRGQEPEALEVLEQDATERGDHEAIVVLLGRRIALAQDRDRRRMLRLRRAAVLEQRLGRFDDAADELVALLGEIPGDPSAQRFLVDLDERRGRPLEAAALLRELAASAATSDERADYGLRSASAFLAGGDLDAAEATLEGVAPIAELDAVIEVRIEIYRLRGDHRALAEALDQLASTSRDPSDRRAALLVEAARASSAVGDEAAALDRAKRALKLAPSSPDALLELRRLEYRSGGAGTPREAQALVDELGRIEHRVSPSQIELYTFLLAESLDAIQGGGAGMRELSKRHAELGAAPLIALGMAERLVRSKSFDAALPLFERALEGDLRGVRSRGRVALAAADAALLSDEPDAASRFFDVAEGEADVRAMARKKRLEAKIAHGSATEARAAIEELLQQSAGVDRARLLLQLGRLIAPNEPDAAEAAYSEASRLASSERSLLGQIADLTAKLSAQREGLLVGESAADPPASPRPPPDAPRPEAHGQGSNPAVAPASPGWVSAAEHIDAVPPSMILPVSELGVGVLAAEGASERFDADEASLLQALARGSYEAGEQLLELYGARSAERTHDVLAIRRRQALIRPGDRGALLRLHEAAVNDGDQAYARAVEHVLGAFTRTSATATRAPEPPPLAAQRPASDLVSSLLFRSVADSAIHEALALVLDTGLYRRDPGQYQLTGVARVQPGAGTPLGDAYGTAARYLGQNRTPLFHRRSSPPPAAGAAEGAGRSFKIALLSPPAIILTGDVREDGPELSYLLGSALAGAMPEHALVNALGDEALQTLIDALNAAFGPVANLPKGNAAVARLGQNLWQLVPPRADRRLRELCADPKLITLDAAVDGTKQAMRRAGLFTSGSIEVALGRVMTEIGVPFARLFDDDGPSTIAAEHPAIGNLIRLSIRGEFAEVRWQTGSASDRRRADGGTRGRV